MIEAYIYHMSIISLGCLMIVYSISNYLVTEELYIKSVILAIAGVGLVLGTVFQVRSDGVSNAAPNNRKLIWFTVLCVLVAILLGAAR